MRANSYLFRVLAFCLSGIEFHGINSFADKSKGRRLNHDMPFFIIVLFFMSTSLIACATSTPSHYTKTSNSLLIKTSQLQIEFSKSTEPQLKNLSEKIQESIVYTDNFINLSERGLVPENLKESILGKIFHLETLSGELLKQPRDTNLSSLNSALTEINGTISNYYYERNKGFVSQQGALSKLILKDKNDVLIHETIIKSIQNYRPNLPVYLAYGEPYGYGPEGNSWMTVKGINVKEYQIFKEGDYWRAREMVGIQFQVVQLEGNMPGLKNTRWADLTRFQFYEGQENPYIFAGTDVQGRNRIAIYIPR